MDSLYQTSITDSALNILLNMCNNSVANCNYLTVPILLPPALQCATGDVCVDCNRLVHLHNEFKHLYPAISPSLAVAANDTVQQGKNRLYEQFMNYRLGFTKTAAEYISFMSQCGTNLFNISCDTLQSIIDGLALFLTV